MINIFFIFYFIPHSYILFSDCLRQYCERNIICVENYPKTKWIFFYLNFFVSVFPFIYFFWIFPFLVQFFLLIFFSLIFSLIFFLWFFVWFFPLIFVFGKFWGKYRRSEGGLLIKSIFQNSQSKSNLVQVLIWQSFNFLYYCVPLG